MMVRRAHSGKLAFGEALYSAAHQDGRSNLFVYTFLFTATNYKSFARWKKFTSSCGENRRILPPIKRMRGLHQTGLGPQRSHSSHPNRLSGKRSAPFRNGTLRMRLLMGIEYPFSGGKCRDSYAAECCITGTCRQERDWQSALHLFT